MEFDIHIDSAPGKPIIKPKVNDINGQKVEVSTNPTTGKQTMRIVRDKPSEKCKRNYFCFFLEYLLFFFSSGNNNNNN